MTRGQIVLCRFPHAAGTPAKLRPALVVQDDAYNRRLANLLVASITTNLANATDPANVLIEVRSIEGIQSGLTQDSVVSCINLAVIPRRYIGRAVGALPAALMRKVDDALRVALGL